MNGVNGLGDGRSEQIGTRMIGKNLAEFITGLCFVGGDGGGGRESL
jgi:hypothetical protein